MADEYPAPDGHVDELSHPLGPGSSSSNGRPASSSPGSRSSSSATISASMMSASERC